MKDLTSCALLVEWSSGVWAKGGHRDNKRSEGDCYGDCRRMEYPGVFMVLHARKCFQQREGVNQRSMVLPG